MTGTIGSFWSDHETPRSRFPAGGDRRTSVSTDDERRDEIANGEAMPDGLQDVLHEIDEMVERPFQESMFRQDVDDEKRQEDDDQRKEDVSSNNEAHGT